MSQLREDGWYHISISRRKTKPTYFIGGKKVAWWHWFMPKFIWDYIFRKPKNLQASTLAAELND